jgi:prefoldin subunit 5
MNLGQFSSLFEVLAGLNLAYAGIDSFRQRIFYLLGEYFTPLDVREQLEDVKNKIKTLAGENKGLNNEIVKLESDYDVLDKLMKAMDDAFLNEGQSFKPVFFMGFLFCVGNLLLMGFEQFFVLYSSMLAEQWLLLWFFYIVIMFFSKAKSRSYRFLANHWIMGSLYITTLALSFGFMYCRWRVPGIIIPDWMIVVLALLVGISPFILDYFRVQKYTSSRTKLLRPKLEKLHHDVSVLDKAIDLVTAISPTLLPKARQASVAIQEKKKQGRKPAQPKSDPPA